jgi:hypothetical protein
MVQAFDRLWVGLVTYLLVIAGTIFLGSKLLPLVAVNTIELAQPYLDSGPPKVSLIEQRQIDSALALPPSHYQERAHVVTIEVPSAAPAILAAQLDLAEKNDLTTMLAETEAAVGPVSESSSIATVVTTFRVARSHPNYPVVTTRDIFNRSFGVITVAAN